jgi:hypothetical protein
MSSAASSASSSPCSLSRCGYNDSRSGYATGGAGCSSYRCTAFADAPRPNVCTASRCNSYCTYYDNHPPLRVPGPMSGGFGGGGSSSSGLGGGGGGSGSSGYRYPERTNSRNGGSSSSSSRGGGSGSGGGGMGSNQQTAVLHNSWTEGWVGHPMDPIGCLFDTLTDASIVPDPNVPHSSPSFFGTRYVTPSIISRTTHRYTYLQWCGRQTRGYFFLDDENSISAFF